MVNRDLLNSWLKYMALNISLSPSLCILNLCDWNRLGGLFWRQNQLDARYTQLPVNTARHMITFSTKQLTITGFFLNYLTHLFTRNHPHISRVRLVSSLPLGNTLDRGSEKARTFVIRGRQSRLVYTFRDYFLENSTAHA